MEDTKCRFGWVCTGRLEARPQDGERVTEQRLLHRLRLHEVMIVLECPRLRDEHIAGEQKNVRKMKVICPFPLNMKVVFIDGFS